SSQLSFLLCITGENNSCPFLCFFLIHPLIVIYYILFILFLQVFGKDFLFNKKETKKCFWFLLLNFTTLVVRNLSLQIDGVSLSSLNLSTVQLVNYLIQYS
ncbi:hypothetical protein C2L96_14840, partial [Bacillus cereus]